MTRQKIGLFLFWLGVVCVIAAYILLWVGSSPHRTSTPAELSGTTWDPDGFLFMFRGQLQLIGTLLVLIGALLFSGEKKSFFWLWGLVPFIIFTLLMFWRPSQYNPVLYGIGGGIIVLSYLGILWNWIKTHTAYEGAAKTGRHIQLLGYTFMFITALFLCLYIGQPNLPGLKDLPVVSGESILVAFSIGWLLLLVGHYVTGKKNKITGIPGFSPFTQI